MKKRIYLLSLLVLMSEETHASRTQSHSEWRYNSLNPPVVTFEMIEDNDLVDKRWGKIEIEEREWHLHWACEGRGGYKRTFSLIFFHS